VTIETLRDIPKRLQTEIGVRTVDEVTLTRMTSESFTHHDAVRVRNGREIPAATSKLQFIPSAVRFIRALAVLVFCLDNSYENRST
jgi:hypothetical protein